MKGTTSTSDGSRRLRATKFIHVADRMKTGLTFCRDRAYAVCKIHLVDAKLSEHSGAAPGCRLQPPTARFSKPIDRMLHFGDHIRLHGACKIQGILFDAIVCAIHPHRTLYISMSTISTQRIKVPLPHVVEKPPYLTPVACRSEHTIQLLACAQIHGTNFANLRQKLTHYSRCRRGKTRDLVPKG